MTVVYFGRDNDVLLVLRNNGVLVDPTTLQKIEIDVGTAQFDSAADPAIVIPESGGVRLRFGSALAVGVYDMHVIAYSVDHPAGVVWGELPFEVR